ncbi:MAG: L-asparaginase, type [Gammaproteobacteria bacterium]|nr:L-asparaginase, type [Gammaproteobacteria bacterium]
MMAGKPKVYILYTGGTIGMKKSAKGFIPAPGYLTEQLHDLAEFKHDSLPDFTVKEYPNLIDSSNMRPENWVEIARDIYEHYNEYDGFIVLHGTDTMAYTASALSFMLENLGKPVICTGAQIALGQLRTDSTKNIIDSLLIAANPNIPEVCIYFNNVLLRGNRSQKIHANSMQAFDSPNFPKLGKAGIDIHIKHSLLMPKPTQALSLRVIKQPLIANLRLFPGISATILDALFAQGIDGLVLDTYGSGNAPTNDPELLNSIRQACDHGVVIVNITQCLQGSVNMTGYATGTALADCGVISGHDMTPEAALTKLYYLFSADYSIAEIRKLMQENLRGELLPKP